MKHLCNKDKARAQFLLNTWEHASRISDDVDPKRKSVNRYDMIAQTASNEFFQITGVMPDSCSLLDLKCV